MILHDDRRQVDHHVPFTGARLGRDPSLDIVFPEDDTVVSGLHCRLWRDQAGAWWLEDLGSTNGTWLAGRRIMEPVRLAGGDRFSLGQRGPALRVILAGQRPATLAEPAIDLSKPQVRLRRVKGGEDLLASGREVVLGRAADCDISLRTVVDTVVSKRHATVSFDDGGEASIADLGSRNGTYINGQQISGSATLKIGDRLMLGWQGPLFEVRVLGAAAMEEGAGVRYQPNREPPRTLAGIVAVAGEESRDHRGRAIAFLKSLARQLATESSFAFRALTSAVLILLAGGVIYVYQEGNRRTAEAEARLVNTQRILTDELRASAEAQRRQSAELDSLRSQLAAARASAVSRSVLDSLERRVRDAESRAASLPSFAPTPGSAAITADFTQVARDNARAVGLVIARYLSDSVMGSGFAITPSGYFVTNRHVVHSEGRGSPRAIVVVMSETNLALVADLVAISSIEDQDVAILRVRGFRGPSVRQVDWQGRGAQQGAPAVMLGFPFGTQLALDPGAGTVRAHLFGGYISQTGDWIRFSGVTYAGVSGSPVFNAAGEVIAVHFGAPRDGPGLGISVPMRHVRRWLPLEARAELGLN